MELSSYVKEENTEEDACQEDTFHLQILLMQHQSTVAERYDGTRAADGGDDGDHGILFRQRPEIYVVGDDQEDGDSDDGPSPVERRAVFPVGIP